MEKNNSSSETPDISERIHHHKHKIPRILKHKKVFTNSIKPDIQSLKVPSLERSHHSHSKIIKNKHYCAKPSKDQQSKIKWYDKPTSFSQKSLVRYFTNKKKLQEKENILGPGSYQVKQNIFIPSFTFHKEKHPSLKRQSIQTQKEEKEQFTIVNYAKMPSSFFRNSLNTLAFNNKELLEKIIRKKTQTTPEDQYQYVQSKSPSPNQYCSFPVPKIKNEAQTSFLSKINKNQSLRNDNPSPVIYNLNQTQTIDKQTSVFISATERFPKIRPLCEQVQYVKEKVKKMKKVQNSINIHRQLVQESDMSRISHKSFMMEGIKEILQKK